MAVVPLALLAGVRLVAWEARPVLVALNSFTAFTFLPVWPVAVVAGSFRCWALLVAAGLVAVAHVGFVAPELPAAEPVPAAARAALRCRVLSASLFVGNPAIGSYAAEMHRLRPDVAVLSEATPALIGGVERARALTDLPHRMTVDRTDPFAMVVASRWPLTEREVVVVRSRPVLVKATVEVAGHRLRLFGVHVVSPESGRYEWVQGMAAVRAAVAPSVPGRARWGLQRHLGPPIVPRAPRHRSHRRRRRPQKALGDDGPANRRPIPPLVRIDHVLTTRELVVTHIAAGHGPGSDHRPLVADPAIPAASPR